MFRACVCSDVEFLVGEPVGFGSIVLLLGTGFGEFVCLLRPRVLLLPPLLAFELDEFSASVFFLFEIGDFPLEKNCSLELSFLLLGATTGSLFLFVVFASEVFISLLFAWFSEISSV